MAHEEKIFKNLYPVSTKTSWNSVRQKNKGGGGRGTDGLKRCVQRPGGLSKLSVFEEQSGLVGRAGIGGSSG